METTFTSINGSSAKSAVKKTLGQRAIELHKCLRGKTELKSKLSLKSAEEISLVYTPGVADVCLEIAADKDKAFEYTSKWNNIAIITDGTRTLGLGHLGPEAALPLMEGKSMLFKQYGNVDAFPICLRTTDTEDIIKVAKNISPVFGAFNIEDIETPKVLHIVERLTEELEIPIFHDDQHGTAVVTLAALLNALKLTGRNLSDTSVVVAGAGSAGYGIVRLLNTIGIKDIVVMDSVGIISKSRQPHTMNKYKMELALITGQEGTGQSLADLVKGRDVFIGVSGVKDLLRYKHVKSMNKNCIVFALTNPDPEIHPKLAMKAGASVVATGSYKYKNRANNVLVFPFIMRTILDNRIKKIDLPMLSRIAFALADLVPSKDLTPYNILPDVSDSRIQEAVNLSLMSKSL